MSSETILLQFHSSLVTFLDELIKLFPDEEDFIRLRIYLKDQISIQIVMDNFIYALNRDSNIMKTFIKDRNISGIMDNCVVTDNLNREKIIYFKKLWYSPRFYNEDRKMIWKWIDSFVGISDKYSKIKSIPSSQQMSDTYMPVTVKSHHSHHPSSSSAVSHS